MKSNKQILLYLKSLPPVTTKINKEFIGGWEDALNYVFFNQEEEEEIVEYLEVHEFDNSKPLTHVNGWLMAYKWLLRKD